MKTSFLPSVILVVSSFVLVEVSEARAGAKILGSSGSWSAFSGSSSNGTKVCGIITGGTGGQSFLIKWFAGQKVLTVDVVKQSWAIPVGTPVKVVMRIDGNSPWTATGKGVSPTGQSSSGKAIEFYISTADLKKFSDQVQFGTDMYISFPDGSEKPWKLTLNGTSQVLQLMVGCVKYVLGNTPQTQPYGASPSQPFGSHETQPSSPALPSQPFSNHETQPSSPSSPFGSEVPGKDT